MLFLAPDAELPIDSSDLALTLGNFDGVHRGHQTLIDRTAIAAGQHGLALAVLTFTPHPARVLARAGGSRRPPLLLTTPADKRLLISRAGANILIEKRFTPTLAVMEAERFAQEVLFESLRVRHLVVGYDFVFGAGRRGTPGLLRHWGAARGVTVEVAEAWSDPVEGVASSSRIREALSAGRVESAAVLLGRPYHLTGAVVQGAQRGRLLGFPTANLRGDNELVPQPGVYAGFLDWGEGQRPVAISVGDNPTFGDTGFSVEAHAFGPGDEPPALSLYGRTCRLSFVARLRDMTRFEGPDALPRLVAQIREDVSTSRAVLSRTPPPISFFEPPELEPAACP